MKRALRIAVQTLSNIEFGVPSLEFLFGCQPYLDSVKVAGIHRLLILVDVLE
jgi:hypothetical protein